MQKPKPLHTIGIVTKAHLDHSGVNTLKNIIHFLTQRKLAILSDEHVVAHVGRRTKIVPHAEIMRTADMVITLGGDGTLIKLAHDVQEGDPVPVLAINLGNVGFLTEVQKKDGVLAAIGSVLRGKYHLDPRIMLRVTIYRNGEKNETFLTLNEAVVNQGNFARLIHLNAQIDQRKMVHFKADGVIIATPTGSTGHSLSAGGPIVHPRLDAFIFTPICPATLAMRPIVLPSNRQLTLTIETQRRFEDHELALTIDGQRTKKLKHGDQIRIRRSSRSLVLVRLTTNKYYTALRDHLGWGD
jgi:NAD+ kinase